MIERAREALEEYRAADAVFQLLEIFHPSGSVGGDYAAAFELLHQIRTTYAMAGTLIPRELEARVRSSPVKEDVTAIWETLQAKLFAGEIPNGPPPEPSPVENEDLLRAIDATPHDPAPYLVYADWLQQQGDPRGQLIILDHALMGRPDAGELSREMTHLLNRYPSLLPERAVYSSRFCGFLSNINLSVGRAEEIGLTLQHPASRFIRELSLEIYANTTMNAEALIASFRRASHLTSLRLRSIRLDLGGGIGVGRLVEALPRLEHLEIDHGGWSLDDLLSAELRTMRLHGVNLSSFSSQVVLPRLRSLSVASYRARFDTVERILFKRNFPSLRHLGLCDMRLPKASCRALSRSDLLPQLESLDLSGCALKDAGIRELVASRALTNLISLDVSRTEISALGIDALKSALKAEITCS